MKYAYRSTRAGLAMSLAALIGCQHDALVVCGGPEIDTLADADDTWRGFSANDVVATFPDSVQGTARLEHSNYAVHPSLAGPLALDAQRTHIEVASPVARVRLDRFSCRRGGKAMRFDVASTWTGTLDGMPFTTTQTRSVLAHSTTDVEVHGLWSSWRGAQIETTGDVNLLEGIEVHATSDVLYYPTLLSNGCAAESVIAVYERGGGAQAGVIVSGCSSDEYFGALY